MNEITSTPLSYQYGNQNYDPNEVDSDRVVLSVLLVDESPSIHSFEDDLNEIYRGYIQRSQNSHIAEELMLSVITFSSNVEIKCGFRPIVGLSPQEITFKHRKNGLTAGYDAVAFALETMLQYGKDLEQVGTDVRYNLAIVTDGQFNDGKDMDGTKVAKILADIRQNEALYGKFYISMSGINKDFEPYFREAQRNMTIAEEALNLYDGTGEDIHNMMDNISKSQSSSSSGNVLVTF